MFRVTSLLELKPKLYGLDAVAIGDQFPPYIKRVCNIAPNHCILNNDMKLIQWIGESLNTHYAMPLSEFPQTIKPCIVLIRPMYLYYQLADATNKQTKIENTT